MPRPWRIRYAGAKYHITARGNGRQSIFLERDDYARFLEQLRLALEKDEVVLYAYCLMPNHYHLFAETPLGNIQRFMQRLNTAYSMYFRYKHARPGHCLQGRYAAKLVGGDEYISAVTRYIHLNPLETRSRKGMPLSERLKYLNDYKWSSYPGYISKEAEEDIVDYRWLSLMGRKTRVGNRRVYMRYVEGMAGKADQVLKKAQGASRYAIGDEKFIEEVESELKEMRMSRACYGDVELPVNEVVEIEDVEKVVADEFGVETEELHLHGRRSGVAKAVAVELCSRLSGKSQREVAKRFGYKTDAGVSWQRRALRERMNEDTKLARQIAKLQRVLVKL